MQFDGKAGLLFSRREREILLRCLTKCAVLFDMVSPIRQHARKAFGPREPRRIRNNRLGLGNVPRAIVYQLISRFLKFAGT